MATDSIYIYIYTHGPDTLAPKARNLHTIQSVTEYMHTILDPLCLSAC